MLWGKCKVMNSKCHHYWISHNICSMSTLFLYLSGVKHKHFFCQKVPFGQVSAGRWESVMLKLPTSLKLFGLRHLNATGLKENKTWIWTIFDHVEWLMVVCKHYSKAFCGGNDNKITSIFLGIYLQSFPKYLLLNPKYHFNGLSKITFHDTDVYLQ